MSEPGRENPSDENRFQILVDAVFDYAIFMMAVDGTVTSWNTGAMRAKGYQAEDIVGRHFSLFYTPEDRAAGLPARALATAAQTGRFEAEGWRVRKDGSRFWANVVIDAIHNPQGDLVGFAKVTRDMTEKRAAERAIRQSEERFRLLVQGVTDYAIFMLDPDGTVANWNAGATRITGYAEAEIVGKHFSIFYTEADRGAGEPRRALQTALQDGRFETEGWRIRKDGSRFCAHIVLDAIHDDAGRLIGYAKITRDITERMNSRRALDQAQAALSQAQKMEAIGKLTGGIAHDFNNLLTVIINSLDLVGRTVTDAKGLKRLEAAHMAADRAATLTQQLLAFARRQPLIASHQDLGAIIRNFEPLLQRASGETAKMRLDLPAGPLPAFIDPSQFEAALLNLVANARDAMPTGGALTIAAHLVELSAAEAKRLTGLSAGPTVQVTVSDTGAGMPPEIMAQAFDPFFTTKEVGKGTGLGLSQVYGFVKQSHGHVAIESEPGRGTQVHLYLPASEAVHEIEAGRKPSFPTAGRALIVEDEEAVLDVAVDVFRDLGYEVLTAVNADSGLEVLRSRNGIDVLFTDVVMPGKLNGLDLATEARAIDSDMTIIVSSGYPLPAMADRKDGLKSFLYLPKPYRWSDLAEKLGTLNG